VPRSDQSQTAILGALSIMPMSGYALRERIRDTLGHFWSESFGQIYPTLAELERQGMVRRSLGDSRSTTFEITDVGINRLRELLAEPAQASRPRNGLLLRLFFGAQLGAGRCRQLVLESREQAEGRLAGLATARADLMGDPGLAPDAPYILLTISAGEHSARAAIDWADDALAALDELEAEAVSNIPSGGDTE